MITWGQSRNPNTQSWQSLGAHAGGDTHTFTQFRMIGNGASLHPLQRTGEVSADSHGMWPRMSARGPSTIGDSKYPAAVVNMTLPPIVSTVGGPRDPNMMVP